MHGNDNQPFQVRNWNDDMMMKMGNNVVEHWEDDDS